MKLTFDETLAKILGEQTFGASNVGATNPTSSAPVAQQNSAVKGQTKPQSTQSQQTQPQNVSKDVMDFLEKNKTNPEFLNVIKKAIEELEKKGQQTQYINQQQAQQQQNAAQG